jgi:hypothetical protein
LLLLPRHVHARSQLCLVSSVEAWQPNEKLDAPSLSFDCQVSVGWITEEEELIGTVMNNMRPYLCNGQIR